jgi:hypothetical protein
MSGLLSKAYITYVQDEIAIRSLYSLLAASTRP